MNKWILVLVLLLTGCSSSESTQTKTYVLPSTEPKTELVFDSVTIIMPSYLQGPGIVYRLSETEIRVANKNVWADNLRVMVKGHIEKYQMPETADSPSLTLEFERFNGAYTGNAELKGSWQLGEKQGEFDIKQPLAEDGYPALVMALSKGLDDVINQIDQAAK